MSDLKRDIGIIRTLAEQYAALALQPIQETRRQRWAAHFGRKKISPPLILVTYGMHNVWCTEVFSDASLQCSDPFYRGQERFLRMQIFHDSIGDDYILEPWFTLGASVNRSWTRGWGLEEGRHASSETGGAWKFDPPIRDWADAANMTALTHHVDEEDTARNLSRLHDAVGDILPIDVVYGPAYGGFSSDISTHLTRLRGMEDLMLDMYEHPAELHRTLAFMRDSILAENDAAEKAGHFSLTTSSNQAMPYATELEPLKPNSGPRKRNQIWGFCAAQEYTLISPEFHEEFLLQYQRPIYAPFAMIHYGCCEDLTNKIDMLRSIPNLRSIAVTPVANVRRSAEQIGRDYVMSWRPNPTDMVCAGWDEARIRRIIRDGFEATRDGYVHLHLKDVETVQGDPSRLARWVRIVRETAESAGA